jgi:hypothetical protein
MSALWGVGQYVDRHDRRAAWEVGNDEMNRAIGAAPNALASLGVDHGARVLFMSMLSEAAHFWPLIVGCMLTGAQLSCADATNAEAVRVRMFSQLIEYHAAVGITPAILDGLDALDTSPHEVFGSIPVVAARPGAYERLAAMGMAAHRFVLIGPAVGIGTEPGGPAWVEVAEWELERDSDGFVTISNRLDRATTFDRLRTSVRGEVIDAHGVIPAAR